MRPLVLLTCLMSAMLGHPDSAAESDSPNHYQPYPAAGNIDEGISWPSGQALPIFATPAEKLDTVSVSHLSPDEQLTVSALQGHVNKHQPRIFLANPREEEGMMTWPRSPTMSLGVMDFDDFSTTYDLIAKYSGDFKGVVLYDTARSPHYRNLAATAASLSGALPVTEKVLERMRDHGMDPEVTLDLTELELISPVEIYNHLYDEYWDRCTHRLIISARPDDQGGNFRHTRDIAAACGAATVWLDGRIPAERDVMRKFFGDMAAGDAIALGWYPTERSGITTASEFGIGTLPADFYSNASVFSGTDHRIQIPVVPKMPELQSKVYIAIIISDGDNIQYTQHAMRRRWDSSAEARTKIPLNWTIAPGLVDIGPGILNYYYTTSTHTDCFVTGPSGMGYAMPANTLTEPGAPIGVYLKDPERMDAYARLTETYLQRSGLRVITIWDDATPMQRAAYEKRCRNLYGATVQNFKDVPSVRGSVEADRVRFDKLVIPYAGSIEHLESSLQQKVGDWDGDKPMFLAYQVDVWHELTPDRIVEIASRLKNKFPDAVQFVRADHYFNLFNQANELPWNLSLSAATLASDRAGSEIGDAVTDGTPTTLWTAEANADDEQASAWLQLDLGSMCSVRRCVIRHAGEHGLNSDKNTRDFVLQASRDGRSWKTIHTVLANTENVSDLENSPLPTRYVRILFDDPGDDAVARIADVEVYGRRI